MRVWAFPSFYPYDYPGHQFVGIFAHYQYKGLIAHGAEVKVLVPVLWHAPGPLAALHPEWKELAKFGYPKERVYDGVQVYHPRIANMKPNRLMRATYKERYIACLRQFFKDQGVTLSPGTDIFYSQWLPNSVLVQEAAHALGLKSATLAIGDDVIVWPKENQNNFNTFKKLMLEADLRMANADYLMREMNKQLGTKLPYEVVYFGVDYDRFKPVSEAERKALKQRYHIPADKVTILTVASPLIRKGWLDLLDALALVKEQHLNFVLAAVYAGQGEFDMVEEVRKRKLEDYFVNIGEIKPAQLNELYNAAELFCLPSHWEGLATVVPESMASGLPIITSGICGHPEVVEHGVTGILTEPKQVPALAAELAALIQDEDKRVRLGAAARDFIVHKMGNFADNAAKLKLYLERCMHGS